MPRYLFLTASIRAYQKHVSYGQETVSIFVLKLSATTALYFQYLPSTQKLTCPCPNLSHYVGSAIEGHTLALPRECCKGDDAGQWRSLKFDPPPRRHPVSGSHKNWQRWLRRGPLHLCKSSSQSTQGFRFRACVTLCAKLHTKGTDFDAKYAKTRGSAQGCAFSGSRT